MSSDLSPELHELLDRKLDTYEKLELVLAVRASDEPLTVADAALQLQVGSEALRRVVDAVVNACIVETLDGDRIRFISGPWDAALDEAATLCASEPRRLARIFTRLAMERIRGLAARTFADAFRIRKKGD